MHNRLLFQVLFASSAVSMTAQVSLTSVTNSLRHGDILCRVELPYADAGERREDAIWTLPAIPDDASDHLQAIRSNGDTTVIYESGRMLHYG